MTQEVRDWQLVRLKLKPEQKVQMNLVGLVVLPYSKQKEKKNYRRGNHVMDQG